MAVSRTEWWNRKRLTAKEADGAIARLVAKNLVFKDHFLFNKQKTTHLRLNISEFFKRYMEELEKRNPPEDQSDTTLKDIHDLYEMIGIPFKDTPEGIPFKDAGIPFKEEVSLNGDSINNLHTTSTTTLNDDDESGAREMSVEARTALFSKLYEENIGPLTPLIADDIQDAVVDYPDASWYVPAMKIAVSNNVRRISYVLRVLRGWKENYFGWKPEFPTEGKGEKKNKKKSKSESTADLFKQYEKEHGYGNS